MCGKEPKGLQLKLLFLGTPCQGLRVEGGKEGCCLPPRAPRGGCWSLQPARPGLWIKGVRARPSPGPSQEPPDSKPAPPCSPARLGAGTAGIQGAALTEGPFRPRCLCPLDLQQAQPPWLSGWRDFAFLLPCSRRKNRGRARVTHLWCARSLTGFLTLSSFAPLSHAILQVRLTASGVGGLNYWPTWTRDVSPGPSAPKGCSLPLRPVQPHSSAGFREGALVTGEQRK